MNKRRKKLHKHSTYNEKLKMRAEYTQQMHTFNTNDEDPDPDY
jgi:hypothetical protein